MTTHGHGDVVTAPREIDVGTQASGIDQRLRELDSERLAAQLQGQRLVTSVFLVKALGGDWQGATRAARL